MNSYITTELATLLRRNPYPLTEIGIGSCARTSSLDTYTPDMQQILRPTLDLTMPTRLVHFDPLFDNQINFLQMYFKSKNIGFTYDDSDGIHIWRSEDNIIEVIIIPSNFYYTCPYKQGSQDDKFLEELCEISLKTNNKLIVQDYSGGDTCTIFKILYNKSPDKQRFRNNILFDISYGQNQCHINLTKYKPIMTPNDDFVNIMLMTVDELMPLIHTNQIIDDHIHNYYKKEYGMIVNVIPIDYRRKMLNDTGKTFQLDCYKNLYTMESSYDEIIAVLQKELYPVISMLKHIGLMDNEKEGLLNELLTNYRNYTLTSKPDIYWWSTQFSLRL